MPKKSQRYIDKQMKKYEKISESQQDLMPAFYIAYKKGDLEIR